MSDIKIMAHIVAGYPNAAGALAAGKALAEGGADILEVQFPFSDPSADGPAIQTACSASLAAGFTTEAGFAFVRTLADATGKSVFIMCYASQVFTPGIAAFCRRAKEAGATGLIVPDLVIGEDEGLADACAACGLEYVPVVAPSITAERLSEIQAARPPRIYAALRAGITGSKTVIDPSSLEFLSRVGSSGAQVMAGFGISAREQVLALRGHADVAIVGSHITRTIAANVDKGPLAIAAAVKAAVAALSGC